jgi:tetratricopeptide (TPR) repeat protein
MEYESGKYRKLNLDDPKKGGRAPKGKKILAAVTAGLLLTALLLVAAVWFLGRPGTGFAQWQKIKNAVSFYVFSGKPVFYSLVVEKNGNDSVLTEKEFFEVSYRDQFVVKKVETDVLSGRGITVSIAGTDKKNDLLVPVKGVDLVDRALLAGGGGGEKREGASSFQVRYKNEMIASVPIRVVITPQDWLRHARKTENGKEQIEYLKKAAEMAPQDKNVRRMLASRYVESGLLAKAAGQYREIVRLDRADWAVKEELAACLFKMGNYGETIPLYEEILKKRPRDAALHANLGYAYGKMGKVRDEIEHYKKALEMKPEDSVLHFNLATAYEKEKRFAEAGSHYEQALKLNPKDDEAAVRLADMRFIEKRYKEAVSLYERAIKKKPGETAIYTRLGYACAEIKQPAKAARYWEKAIKMGEKDPQVKVRLAKVHAQGGNPGKEKALYEKIAVQQPTKENLRRMAEIYSREKQYDKALDTYGKLIRMEPKNASLYSSAAYLYGLKGNRDKQIEYYKLALKQDPEDFDSHLNLAAACEKEGLLGEALKEYTAAYRVNPESQTAARSIPRIKIMIIRQKQIE